MLGAILSHECVATPAATRQSPDPGQLLRAGMGSAVRQATAGRYHLTAGPASAIDQERVTRLVAALPVFEDAYRTMWRGHPALHESAARVEIFLIVESGHLRRIIKEAGIALPEFDTGGLYLKESATLIIENLSLLERSILASLVHETTHFLNHEILRGDAFPPWLNEGLAQYCEYSRYTGGGAEARFDLGVIDPGSELRVPHGKKEMIFQFTPARSLSYLQGQFMRDHRLSLGPLLEARDAARYYGKGAQLRYAQSWTLVHLLTQATGPLREPFFRYAALADRQEAGSADTLLQALGMSLKDLDDAWYRHLKQLW